jgi:hypothetical protein
LAKGSIEGIEPGEEEILTLRVADGMIGLVVRLADQNRTIAPLKST